MWSIKLINFLFLCRNLTTVYKKYKGEISPPPPLPFKTSTLQHTKQILTESKTKKQKTKPNPEKSELLQKCLKGVAFIRITPMAKKLKYQRINVILSWFYISQSTGEQFVSSYFIYNENNALVHSIDFERSIQNEKELGNVYIDRCCRI